MKNLLISLLVIVVFILPKIAHAQPKVSKSLDELMSELKTHPQEDTTRFYILQDIIRGLGMERFSESIPYGNASIELARKLGIKKLLANALIGQATTEIRLALYLDAAKHLQEGIEIAESDDALLRQRAGAYGRMSWLYSELRDAETESKYLVKALHLTSTHNMEAQRSEINISLGALYLTLKEYHKATEAFEEGGRYLASKKDWQRYIIAKANTGASLTSEKKYAAARAAFDSCYIIMKQYNIPSNSTYNVSLVGLRSELFIQSDTHPDSAVIILNNYINEPEFNDVPFDSKIDLYKTLCKAYLKVGNFSAAAAAGEKALSLEPDQKNAKSKEIRILLSQAYSGQGSWKDAYQYAAQAEVIQDSLEEISHKNAATLNLIHHEVESRERELITQNEGIKRSRIVFIVALLLCIPLLILLTWALILNRKHTAALNVQMDLKKTVQKVEDERLINEKVKEQLTLMIKERTEALEVAHKEVETLRERENASLALQNQKYQDFLNHIKSRILLWVEMGEVKSETARPLLSKLKANHEETEEWDAFTLHFERIHPRFFQVLQSACPNLSPLEQKHCAYLRLNLSRKETANLMSCTEDAVKLARYRIKKKLGLNIKDSLSEYIAGLDSSV